MVYICVTPEQEKLGIYQFSSDRFEESVLTFKTMFLYQQEIMVGSMYQAETPVGLCKYKENEKGKLSG